MNQLLVIGSGVAGTAAVECLLEKRAAFDITMFEAENSRGVNTLAWCQKRGVGLQLGLRVVDIDAAGKTVTADDGSITPFDVLLIAAGTAPSLPHVIGVQKRNVFTGRDVVRAMSATSTWPAEGNIVVITDSLEGLETARELTACHSRISVVLDPDAARRDRLDATTAKHLISRTEAAGIEVIAGKRVTAVIGNGRAESLDFEDGSELRADAVVIPAVMRPDIELSSRAGLIVNEGIIVDDHMRASAEDVFAAGECTEHRRVLYRDRGSLLEQARAAAGSIAGERNAVYRGAVQPVSRRILDVDVFTAGEFDEAAVPGAEVVRYEDPALGVYKKLLLSDGRLAGLVLVGDVTAKDIYVEWMSARTDVSSIRGSLLAPAASVVL